jgi:hypothetical protein
MRTIPLNRQNAERWLVAIGVMAVIAGVVLLLGLPG